MSRYLELVEECEHGYPGPHWIDHKGESTIPTLTYGNSVRECPGGSRRRVDPDMSAGAKALYKRWTTRDEYRDSDLAAVYERDVKIALDAALGLAEEK